ncbi:MAG: hypothetical protein MK008_06880 [Bdellovibrionales bacterium]|nr:hypothetical protein [Bdellovibrionales bacterium]
MSTLLLTFNNCSGEFKTSQIQSLNQPSVIEPDESIGENNEIQQPVGDIVLQGSLESGQKLTITGQNFGVGPKVIIYDDFSGIPEQEIALNSPVIGQWSHKAERFKPRYHSYGYSGTSYSMSDDLNPDSIYGAKRTQLGLEFEDSQQVFISYQVAVPPGKNFSGANQIGEFGTASHWKFSWLMDGKNGFGHEDGKADLCIPTNGQAEALQIGGNTDGIGWVGGLDELFDLNGFNRMTAWLKADPQKPLTDGYTWFQMTSDKIGSTFNKEYNKPVFNEESSNSTSTKWNYFNLPGWYGNNQTNTGGVYDDLYMAIGPNAASRVEVGSKALYEDNVDLSILPSLTWTNNEIEVLVKFKDNMSIRGKYLFIFNAENQIIKTIKIP